MLLGADPAASPRCGSSKPVMRLETPLLTTGQPSSANIRRTPDDPTTRLALRQADQPAPISPRSKTTFEFLMLPTYRELGNIALLIASASAVLGIVGIEAICRYFAALPDRRGDACTVSNSSLGAVDAAAARGHRDRRRPGTEPARFRLRPRSAPTEARVRAMRAGSVRG